MIAIYIEKLEENIYKINIFSKNYIKHSMYTYFPVQYVYLLVLKIKFGL